MRSRKAKTLNTVGNRFTPTADYFRIAMHEQSGDDMTITGQLDGTAFTDSLTLVGTPDDTIWTGQPGWYNGEGDNYALIASVAQVASIMTPANYSSGGVLALVGTWLDSGRTPISESATVIQFGARGVTGGYSVEFNNGANANFSATAGFPSGTFTSTSKPVSSLEDQFIPGHAFFNWADSTSSLLGVTNDLSDTSSWDYQGGTLSTGVPANYDIGFNTRVNSGPTASNILNGTVNINWKQHDIWIIAFDAVPTSAIIQAILSDFAANPYEKLVSIP